MSQVPLSIGMADSCELTLNNWAALLGTVKQYTERAFRVLGTWLWLKPRTFPLKGLLDKVLWVHNQEKNVFSSLQHCFAVFVFLLI